MLLLYVDYMLLTSKNMNSIIKLNNRLSVEFEMKYLSRAKKILGTNIVTVIFLLDQERASKVGVECNRVFQKRKQVSGWSEAKLVPGIECV